MFYNLIVEPTHEQFNEFMIQYISAKNSKSLLLRKSEFIYCNQNQTQFIFHIDADFGNEQIQQEVMELFKAIPGCVRNLNVLNVSFTIDDIADKTNDLGYIEELFSVYLNL